jgi:hypothetical protein
LEPITYPAAKPAATHNILILIPPSGIVSTPKAAPPGVLSNVGFDDLDVVAVEAEEF